MPETGSAGGGAPGAAGASGAVGPARAVDPFTAEVLRQAFIAVTDEMKTTLMRTAYNMIITEGLDFTVGLFDAAGDTVSIGLGLPMFIRGMSDTIKSQVAHVGGASGLRPGDVLLTNDSYTHGSHLNHMVFTLPVFHEGQVVAYACTMAHWQDIGGTLGGRTTDIYTEGLQLPVVRIYKEGVLDEDLVRIIRANVRFPELAMGDFRAQVAAIRTGERRLQALLRRYGGAAVTAVMALCMDDSEERARAAVSAMPDGFYEAESFMDDDGVVDRPIPIRVRVEVRGDRMVVDLTDVGEQVRGYYNAGETAGRSAAQVAFRCLTAPLDLPINDGAFRPLEVVLPPGRVVSARKPAAMRWWMTVPMTVADTIIRALAPAAPERAAAGHHADLLAASFFGQHPQTGRLFIAHLGSSGGGFGARRGMDGACATYCLNDGDSHNRPVEVLEHRHPLRIESYSLRTDSGGAGRWRGGLGTVRGVRLLGAARLNAPIERTRCAPWGLAGGRDGLPNRLWVKRADGAAVTFPTGKVHDMDLAAGDVVWVESGGGGGYGDPRQRPAEAVSADVHAGYVSAEAARRDYGLDGDPEGAAVRSVPPPGESGSGGGGGTAAARPVPPPGASGSGGGGAAGPGAGGRSR